MKALKNGEKDEVDSKVRKGERARDRGEEADFNGRVGRVTDIPGSSGGIRRQNRPLGGKNRLRFFLPLHLLLQFSHLFRLSVEPKAKTHLQAP